MKAENTRTFMFAIIARLNEISDLRAQGEPYTDALGRAAADLRWALAEGGLSLRERVGKLASANRLIGKADHYLALSTRQDRHPEHSFLLDAAEIVLSEIYACAGEKRHDWRKMYKP